MLFVLVSFKVRLKRICIKNDPFFDKLKKKSLKIGLKKEKANLKKVCVLIEHSHTHTFNENAVHKDKKKLR